MDVECYRGNDIENYDTACCRIRTKESVEILFYTTHCCDEKEGPVFCLEFENARIDYAFDGQVTAIFSDGRSREYGSLAYGADMRKLNVCLERCRSAEHTPLICELVL